jgi:hypothetical protein
MACGGSALPRLVAGIGLVDDVNATLTPDQAIVAMALHQRPERIADFHDVTKNELPPCRLTCGGPLFGWKIVTGSLAVNRRKWLARLAQERY